MNGNVYVHGPELLIMVPSSPAWDACHQLLTWLILQNLTQCYPGSVALLLLHPPHQNFFFSSTIILYTPVYYNTCHIELLSCFLFFKCI